jgi:hypothetical protein
MNYVPLFSVPLFSYWVSFPEEVCSVQRGDPMKVPLSLPSLLLIVSLLGCAGMITDVASLRNQGYQPISLGYATATGERREPGIELWWKETQDPQSRAHFCLVPQSQFAGAGYQWAMAVEIDGKETWIYESGSFGPQPTRRMGIDCTVTVPLPEGQLTFRVTQFQFWH